MENESYVYKNHAILGIKYARYKRNVRYKLKILTFSQKFTK